MAEITHNHPQGGRSFSVTATNGNSNYVLVANFAGLTVKAASGTARVWQTSSGLNDVTTGNATWEIWAYGTTAPGGALHGAVQGASAIYLEAIGGTSTLGIRD
jgi:hypothetical protein